jgi:arsenate reductase
MRNFIAKASLSPVTYAGRRIGDLLPARRAFVQELGRERQVNLNTLKCGCQVNLCSTLSCNAPGHLYDPAVKITIYQKPTCTTCRQVHAALRDAGVDFDAVDYYTDPIPKAKLKDLLRKMRMPARELLRTKEDIYKELRLGERELTDDQIVDLMVKHPDLIQRPIVEKGARAILARPAERLREIL